MRRRVELVHDFADFAQFHSVVTVSNDTLISFLTLCVVRTALDSDFTEKNGARNLEAGRKEVWGF